MKSWKFGPYPHSPLWNCYFTCILIPSTTKVLNPIPYLRDVIYKCPLRLSKFVVRKWWMASPSNCNFLFHSKCYTTYSKSHNPFISLFPESILEFYNDKIFKFFNVRKYVGNPNTWLVFSSNGPKPSGCRIAYLSNGSWTTDILWILNGHFGLSIESQKK